MNRDNYKFIQKFPKHTWIVGDIKYTGYYMPNFYNLTIALFVKENTLFSNEWRELYIMGEKQLKNYIAFLS